MAEIQVVAEERREHGSRPARRLRTLGKIPAVVYGHGTEPVSVAVDARSLRTALTTESGLNALIDLKIGASSHLVVARELQRHPVRGTVAHVDFQVVRRDEIISADVPIAVTGDALEVSHGDGRVEQQMFSIPVKALPADIPTGLEIDVTDLTIGATIKVSDLDLPSGVVTELDPETVIVVGQPPRKVAVGGEEGGEGEAAAAPESGVGAPAGGEAPAAAESSGEG